MITIIQECGRPRRRGRDAAGAADADGAPGNTWASSPQDPAALLLAPPPPSPPGSPLLGPPGSALLLDGGGMAQGLRPEFAARPRRSWRTVRT